TVNENRKISNIRCCGNSFEVNIVGFAQELVSTANTPHACAASTPTCANTGGSSFVYLGGQIPIDASTLPNADLSTDPNMANLEDDLDVF
ncbi:hypothetical protein Tco_1233625, partial [Tanacetum coccineum]